MWLHPDRRTVKPQQKTLFGEKGIQKTTVARHLCKFPAFHMLFWVRSWCTPLLKVWESRIKRFITRDFICNQGSLKCIDSRKSSAREMQSIKLKRNRWGVYSRGFSIWKRYKWRSGEWWHWWLNTIWAYCSKPSNHKPTCALLDRILWCMFTSHPTGL